VSAWVTAPAIGPMRADRSRRVLAAAFLVAIAVTAHAATVVVVNGDGVAEGFNDQTPMTPVGGNPGTTLGEQRLNAFEHAADLWGASLVSGVVVRVDATMDPLPCNSTTATLGQASPTSVVRDFPGAPFAGTWYPLALANALAGSDLASGESDVTAQFSSVVGTTCALPVGWYYGFDGLAPADTIDFVTVVFHELGHGLGFETFVDPSSGAELLGRPDIFERQLADDDVSWRSMTDLQRKASAVHTGHLVWTGPTVLGNAGLLSSGRDPSGNVLMYAPGTVEVGSSVSHWDTSLTPDQLLEPFYSEPIHDPSLTLDALADLGWGTTAATTTTPGSTSTTTTSTLPLTCPPSPDSDCRAATRSSLSAIDRPGDTNDVVTWAWRGANTVLTDYGDPTAPNTMLRLCVYDASARVQPLAAIAIDAGGQCRNRSCWRPLGKPARRVGFGYRNTDATPNGIATATLRARPNGTGRIAVKGKGPNLGMPALGLTVPVTVQLSIADAGGRRCWQATYAAARRNDTSRFRAAGP
jgi:hypothetical protein